MNKRFGRNDFVLMLTVLLVAISLFFAFKLLNNDNGNYVVITVDGNTYGSYSLEENRTVEITDKAGKTTNILKITDGKAKMIKASCPDLICVHQKEISLVNESIICLPNKVVIKIEGENESELDSISN